MKIAIVHNFHTDSTPSGEDLVVAAEAEALTAVGVDVKIVGLDNDRMAEKRLHLPLAAFTTATGHGLSPLELLGDFKPDVIHVHNLFPYFGRTWASNLATPIVST